MIIDNKSNKSNNISSSHQKISNRDKQKDSRKLYGKIFVASASLMIVTTAFLAGIEAYKQVIARELQQSLKADINLIATGKYFKGLLFGSAVPTLRVDMKFKHFDKIAAKREEALEMGGLFTLDDDLVPAKIQFQGREIPVKMRLKGDITDHLETDKWSYRIQVKGNDQLLGMRRFSIQHPMTRNYLYEWAWLHSLRREDVLALRYQFVNVVFNGTNKGVFALEEHFSKELLESQQRREGVIVTFDEEMFWRENNANPGVINAKISTRGNSRVSENSVLSRERDTAVALLQAFQENKLPASEVFDVPLLAKFLATSELWGAHHALYWNNMNFYYNPVTAKLEPIGFDGIPEPNKLDHNNLFRGESSLGWVGQALKDPVVAEAYHKELYRITQPEYLQQLKAELNEPLEKWQLVLYRDFSFGANNQWLVTSVWDNLETRATHILGYLNNTNTVLTFADNDRQSKGDNTLQVEVRNRLKVPVEVLGFKIGEKFISADASWVKSSGQIYNRDGQSTVVLPVANSEKEYIRPVENALFRFSVDADIEQTSQDSQSPKLKVVTRPLGSSKSHEIPVNFSPHNRYATPVPNAPKLEQALAKYPFLEKAAQNVLRLKQGEWDVEGDLVLPKGMRLQVHPGTKLRFEPNAIFLSRGPLEFLGTAEAPIVLEPQKDSWGGLVVLEAEAPSQWEYVTVKNTRGIGPDVNPKGVDRKGWILTGGTFFYKSPIFCNYCRILGSEAEDGINVYSSSFEFKNSEFASVTSDAFDGDFVEGVVEASIFRDIAGDAIDVSGSKVRVENVALLDVGDKAISAGEGSQLEATDITTVNSGIGVASKDLSQVKLNRAVIKNAKHAGLAAYKKKPEFGPGDIEATNIDFQDTTQNTLVQTESWIELDGNRIEGTEVDVKAMYEAGILGN